jgi:gamma-glutamyltranspeptidase/glutathione hydrolase/leukotriene-C4 hydrolase
MKGQILEAMLKKVHKTGGILTAEDFLNYRPLIRPALKGTFRNRTVYTSHAPSSGPVLLHMLNLHEKFESTSNKGLSVHRFVETMKCKFISGASV